MNCNAMPYPVSLCPNPDYRKQYIASTRHDDSTEMRLYMAHRCLVAWTDHATKCNQALKCASPALNDRKEQSVREEIVNAARILLRSELCVICMEEAPTICSLCYDQALHFTCLSNW